MKSSPKKVYYWDRRPGRFVNPETGELSLDAPIFDGSIQDWYESLLQTIATARSEIASSDSIVGTFECCLILEHTRWFLVPSSSNFSLSQYEFGTPKGQILGLPLYEMNSADVYDEQARPLCHICGNDEYSTIVLLGFNQ